MINLCSRKIRVKKKKKNENRKQMRSPLRGARRRIVVTSSGASQENEDHARSGNFMRSTFLSRSALRDSG